MCNSYQFVCFSFCSKVPEIQKELNPCDKIESGNLIAQKYFIVLEAVTRFDVTPVCTKTQKQFNIKDF